MEYMGRYIEHSNILEYHAQQLKSPLSFMGVYEKNMEDIKDKAAKAANSFENI